MDKPRLTHAEYMRIAGYPKGSVALLIERYIREMNGTDSGKPIRVLGPSHEYTLRRLQKSPIGQVVAADLTKHYIIEHCKWRRDSVCPATINGDVGYLAGVLKYAPSAWEDCDAVSDSAVSAARPFLVKHGYIGKSMPRTRVPEGDEIPRLLAYLAQPPKHPCKNWIYAMPDIVAFALVSTRRLGEICRITHADVDWDHKDEAGNEAPIYWVRDMKHPTKRLGNHKSFTLFPELAEIIRRQPRKDGDDRIFPFYDKSVGAKYTRAKAALGIVGLRFHDNRRKSITEWLKVLPPHSVRKFLSGHNTGAIFDRVYDVTDPADGHAARRQVPEERVAA